MFCVSYSRTPSIKVAGEYDNMVASVYEEKYCHEERLVCTARKLVVLLTYGPRGTHRDLFIRAKKFSRRHWR